MIITYRDQNCVLTLLWTENLALEVANDSVIVSNLREPAGAEGLENALEMMTVMTDLKYLLVVYEYSPLEW